MGSAREIGRGNRKKDHDGAGRDDGGSHARVERLRREFSRFRRTHPLRTRIPDPLRQAVLTALARGTAEEDVRRACGITSDQLALWRKAPQACEPRRALRRAEPRIFPVVDDAVDISQSSDPETQVAELELRFGGWSISVRQLQR